MILPFFFSIIVKIMSSLLKSEDEILKQKKSSMHLVYIDSKISLNLTLKKENSKGGEYTCYLSGIVLYGWKLVLNHYILDFWPILLSSYTHVCVYIFWVKSKVGVGPK